ncbi:MAG: serine/threonine-protein phosphatase [Jatrophihabitans endophyticus]|nr:serine/threonine-protein phosphatase [Jatrophihabitans endophyticus]
MTSSALTHPGLVRSHNEDSMLVTERLAAVADGLGGHAAGEVASRLAVDRMRELGSNRTLHPDDIIDAVADTNRLILEQVARDPEQAGMGTTLCGVALVVLDGVEQCAVFNVGDSRVYRYVQGVFDQVSIDHSEVQELQDAGQITPEAAAVYPRRNIITRCLGTDPAPVPDVWTFVPSTHERFLICSDGLSGEVDDTELERALAEHESASDAADSLLAQALANGGRDNVTIVVVDVAVAAAPADAEPAADPAPPVDVDSGR